ncbi:MAG: hypothetical protein KAH38_08155 [Candidatus Hydrogenedentes bacterium]|nr:hypothetical protein [Candidatus Hydrogenedentota bacterium]
MSLDPTASEFYFRSSIKKYFIDTLVTGAGKIVLFDKTILYEEVRDRTVTEWFVINFGQFRRSYLSTNVLEVNCCTRNDTEGIALSKLTDTLIENITDPTKTDTTQRITLYNSTNANPATWTAVGGMMVTDIMEGIQQLTSDGTKVKGISFSLRWGTVI